MKPTLALATLAVCLVCSAEVSHGQTDHQSDKVLSKYHLDALVGLQRPAIEKLFGAPVYPLNWQQTVERPSLGGRTVKFTSATYQKQSTTLNVWYLADGKSVKATTVYWVVDYDRFPTVASSFAGVGVNMKQYMQIQPDSDVPAGSVAYVNKKNPHLVVTAVRTEKGYQPKAQIMPADWKAKPIK